MPKRRSPHRGRQSQTAPHDPAVAITFPIEYWLGVLVNCRSLQSKVPKGARIQQLSADIADRIKRSNAGAAATALDTLAPRALNEYLDDAFSEPMGDATVTATVSEWLDTWVVIQADLIREQRGDAQEGLAGTAEDILRALADAGHARAVRRFLTELGASVPTWLSTQ